MLLSFMLRKVRTRRILRGGADDDSDSSGSDFFGSYVTRITPEEDNPREDILDAVLQDLEEEREEKISNALEHLREENPPAWATPYLNGSLEPDDNFLRLYEEWVEQQRNIDRQDRIMKPSPICLG